MPPGVARPFPTSCIATPWWHLSKTPTWCYLYCVFTYIHFPLIEKDICDRQNISSFLFIFCQVYPFLSYLLSIQLNLRYFSSNRTFLLFVVSTFAKIHILLFQQKLFSMIFAISNAYGNYNMLWKLIYLPIQEHSSLVAVGELPGSKSCGRRTAEKAMLTPACITILWAIQLATTCRQ